MFVTLHNQLIIITFILNNTKNNGGWRAYNYFPEYMYGGLKEVMTYQYFPCYI